jgi:hypothetical protein
MRLFAFCILFASLASHVVGQNGKTNSDKPTTESRDTAGTKNPTPQVIIQSQSNQQPADQQDAACKEVKHSFLPSPEWTTAGSTFCILIATTAYAVISYFSLKKIGRQVVLSGVSARAARDGAKAAKDGATAALNNANAAQLSARSAINAERAWVSVFIERTNQPNQGYSLKAVNYGRTPAHVVKYVLAPFVEQNSRETQLQGVERDVNIWVLPDRESVWVCDFDASRIAGAHFGDVRNGVKKFAIKGCVIYLNLIDAPVSESQWEGFINHLSGFRLQWESGHSCLEELPRFRQYT